MEEQSRDVGCKSTGAGGCTSAGAPQIGEQGRRRQCDGCFGEPGQQVAVEWVCAKPRPSVDRTTKATRG